MKPISIFLMFLILIIHFSCKKPDNNDNQYKINENIIPVVLIWGINNEANIPCAIWPVADHLISVKPIADFTINENYQVVNEMIFEDFHDPHFIGFQSRFIRESLIQGKYLLVKSIYSDVSVGSLVNFNSENNSFQTILDSTYNVSSACYYRDTNNIIYYSYGKPEGTNPGYYLYNKKNASKQLLLEYISEIGPSEYLNGFDIHPTKDILIIPVVRRGKTPLIIEYNFAKNTFDTLHLTFDLSLNRICLWLRYNKTGEKILYSCYPRHAGTTTTNDDSEIGIIDMNTLTKIILDVNTSISTGRSVSICPNWSPDEKHIIYSSGPLSKDGARGLYRLYILKTSN